MKKLLSREYLGAKTAKSIEITSFSGQDDGNFGDGVLLEGKNVTISKGGSIVSLPAAKKLNTYTSVELCDGVYTLCEDYDKEYETPVSREWMYKNVFPESVRAYGENDCSRVLVKGIGMPPKTENGYRNIKGTFFDGERLFIFYEARYNIIDNIRNGIFESVGDALSWRFYSSKETNSISEVKIYLLTQLFLDVIDGDRVESSLIDARLDLIRSIDATKYKWSRLISEDKVNYKYNSPSYIPIVGANYTAYYDRVYTELYPNLESERKSGYEEITSKSIVKYRNLVSGGTEFSAEGEKMLLMPDKRLLVRSGGAWKLSDALCETVPSLDGAVQLYDRLYGIENGRLLVSAKGNCTDFQSEGSAWETVTADGGGFTAIVAFCGRVAVFTRKSMLTVRGNELPFTLSHEADSGCISQSSLAVVRGKLYFVSENGIFETGGGNPKCISDGFPKGIDYSTVMLTEACGMLVASIGTLEQAWVYNPASNAWSTLAGTCDVCSLEHEYMLVQKGSAYTLHRLFCESGEFDFFIALKPRKRHRLCSIAVTAAASPDSELSLYDENGNVTMNLYSPTSRPTLYTCSLNGRYADSLKLHFGGYGDVTLYGIKFN